MSGASGDDSTASAEFGEVVWIYAGLPGVETGSLAPVEHQALPGARWTVGVDGTGDFQVKLLSTRDEGQMEVWIQRDGVAGADPLPALHLRAAAARRLVEVLSSHAFASVDGMDQREDEVGAVRVVNLKDIYALDPELVRELVANDVNGRDVVALAHRRAAVEEFAKLLDDAEFFASRREPGKGKEAVWQAFFERNPWILGGTVSAQMMGSWNVDRLEQTVAGWSITSAGKRVDALLETAGLIRSIAFVELKHHETNLLTESSYRSGCWGVSAELAGGIAQCHATAQLAVESVRDRLQAVDEDGVDLPGEFSYFYRPRSYLIIGSLREFLSEAGAHHLERFRSFELLRRSLSEPEVITFDELLARARGLVAAHT